MKKYYYLAVLGTLLMGLGMFLLAQTPTLAQETPEPMPLAEFHEAWATSGHADAEAEAFTHWDEEEEKVVPADCAKCHSTPGYLDFLGHDGTDFGTVENPAPLGTTVTCDACHNSVTSTLSSVVFPSGAEVTGAGDAARCMQCHQGRSSGNSVNASIENAALADVNTPSPDLRFINIHYYAAAATLYGSEAAGGYQYDGKVYQMRNEHVPGFDTCISCHSPHTLEIQIEECQTCHVDVESVEDLRDIRMNGSLSDYDGDGDIDEGIAGEIETLQEMLYTAMQNYSSEFSGAMLAYNSHAYPYFFADPNADGELTEEESIGDNAFRAFTPALLKAAYNYQVSLKDTGAFAHNPTYIIELLYDSIEDLNMQMGEPVDLSLASRTDPGHFDTTGEPFRHWDEDGEVPGTCSRCHSATGLPTFLKNGVNIAVEPSNSLTCSTCHDSLEEFTVREALTVTFPSGAKLSFSDDPEEADENNLCLACHQGRESTVSVNRAITTAGVGDDEITDKLTFRNVHYFSAGATLFGSEAMGAYQYEGKEYNGRFQHGGEGPTACTECHDEHELVIEIRECSQCHDEVDRDDMDSVHMIRLDGEDIDLGDGIDYDGDGNNTEPIRDEIATMEETLFAALQSYAAGTAGTSVAYDSHSHPYFFIDTNGDGMANEDEVNSGNRYVTWTPTLLRAAYNYQYAQKDPGDFAHNADYVMQFLYDSIEAVGGDVSAMTRPEVSMGE